MNITRFAVAFAVMAVALACAPASAQTTDATDLVPNTTFNSTSAGALQRRSPGNWVMRAMPRSPDITRPDPYGEDFWPQLVEAVLQTFVDQINAFIAGLTTLLNLSSLLGGIVDASDLPADTQVAMISPAACIHGSRRLESFFT